jgi:replicative DNA helicase
MMIDGGSNICIPDVIIALTAEDFYRQDHREIYNAILVVYESTGKLDWVLLKNELGYGWKSPELDYLLQVSESVPSPANGKFYAANVKNKALLRQSISVCTKLINDAYNPQVKPSEFFSVMESELLDIGESLTTTTDALLSDVLPPVVADIVTRDAGDVLGLRTHYSDLDAILGGLRLGELTVVAARPSMGKTALGLNIAENVALKDKLSCAIFSLEMSKESLAERMLSGESHIDSSQLRSGLLTPDDREVIGYCNG